MASRPRSIGNRIVSRLVRVSSMGHDQDPTIAVVSMT